MNNELLAVTTAYFLDLAVGDPQWRWHPVRIIGKLVARLELGLNTGRINKRLAGAMLVVLTTSAAVFSVFGILRLAGFIHPALHFVISVTLIYFSLSIKALDVEANKVYGALKNKNIREARNSLSMIVGRDTQNLEEPQVIRAAVETVAESTMDGIIAPLFYAFLGGPVLVWAYKAINTLDSMVGHRNERFTEFGKASAGLDGIVNFIPAKITCILIGISCLFYGRDFLNSFRWGLKYFFRGFNFNGVVTEAAMAGALKVQLGGVNFYDSVPVAKPLIGEPACHLRVYHIRESIRLAYLSSFIFLMIWIFSFFMTADFVGKWSLM